MLLFIDGFDHYTAQSDMLTKWPAGGSSAANSMTTGLLGVGQCARYGSAGPTLRQFSTTDVATIVFGFRFRTSNTGSNDAILVLKDGSNNIVGDLAVGANASIGWYRGGGGTGNNNQGTAVVTSAAGLLAINAVNYIEVKVTLATGATGSVDIHLNGASVASASSVQTANTTAGARIIGIGGGIFNNTNVDFDDFYLCDTTGAQNNNFLGDVKVVTVMPNGAGRVTQWTPNGAANDWSCVKDTAPDGDTTYVSSATAGNIDCYTLASAGSPTTLFGVQINTDVRKDDTAVRTVAHGVGNGTTESFDAGTNVGTTYGYLVRTLDTNPLTSAAWAAGDLTTLQSAIKCIA